MGKRPAPRPQKRPPPHTAQHTHFRPPRPLRSTSVWTVGNTDPGAADAVGTQYTVTQASVSSPCVVSKSATSSRRGRALREVTFSAADHEFLRNRRRLDEHVHLQLG